MVHTQDIESAVDVHKILYKIGLVQVWSLHPEFGESFLNYLNSFISFLFPEIENNQQLPSAAIRAKNCIAQPARFKVIHLKY